MELTQVKHEIETLAEKYRDEFEAVSAYIFAHISLSMGWHCISHKIPVLPPALHLVSELLPRCLNIPGPTAVTVGNLL